MTEHLVHPRLAAVLSYTRILVKAALSGQKDKQGVSKFDHCIRVEKQMCLLITQSVVPVPNYLDYGDFRLIALMHDLLEDSDLEIADLEALAYPPHILSALELLTHDEEEDYEVYIDRLCASGNLLAIAGKLADNRDNTDPVRLDGLPADFRAYLDNRYFGVREKLETALAQIKEAA